MKYVVSRIDEGKKLIQEVIITKAIHWLQVVWKDVSTEAIVPCFQKCNLEKSEPNSTCIDSKIDEEFANFLNQLRDDDDITVEDFLCLITM